MARPAHSPSRRASLESREAQRRRIVSTDGAIRVTFAHEAIRGVPIGCRLTYREREPEQSLNFVTCHDGFTLNDLVSYNSKHNEANGEGNRDGMDNNLSWNCGVEGETQDPAVEALRNQQIRNFV